MRKTIVSSKGPSEMPQRTWLDVEHLAAVDAVCVLERQIVPDIGDRDARASLSEWRLA